MTRQKIEEGFGSIMVMVPHQDDEVLMCGGIIANAIKKQLGVTVVMVTNGDYGSPDFTTGRKRLKEMLEGLAVLGVSRDSVVFLGYGDTGMSQEESFLNGLYEEKQAGKVHPSHCSQKTYGLEDMAEFHMQEYGVHGLYTKENCYEDIRAVIKKYNPENIFTTSGEDVHGDHSALFFLVRAVLVELEKEGYKPDLYSGLVHSKAGDENWPLRCGEIEETTCPEGLEETSELVWEDRVSFGVPEEMLRVEWGENLKALALSKHVTALKPDAVDFLHGFLKADEVFWKMGGGHYGT